ncbi:polygalacturonase inhibitor 2 [Cajanus cajan]|uniref:polygalacturonase inhibitor 2 n=1 Tax=Cajanus cajan TaxID=3821 RepID=UPI00098D9A2A|nr:polygalacturonase inhibitor 2 [Cajanus cajan]
MSRLSIIIVVIVAALSLTPALSDELCNPRDKKALLQFKKDLGNPTTLSSWLPNTDCCNPEWDGVLCDTDNKTYRVNQLYLTNLNLSKPYPIPSSVSRLPYLNLLYLTTTPNLLGQIPSSIVNLTKLHYLYITRTSLSGQIPQFLSHMKTIVTFDLSYNNLSGTLPPSLSSLPNLQGLAFDGNRITGPIPDSYGSFSHKFTSLTLSRNRLTGEIPATLADLNLTFVDLSLNKLEGDASVLFGSDKNTQEINLAKNLLEFDFGNVKLSKDLESLDIRNNRVYGTLPKGLTALKYLSRFNVSYNNLCGEIPQGGNLQRFGASSYAHNKCLCGSPLPSCT